AVAFLSIAVPCPTLEIERRDWGREPGTGLAIGRRTRAGPRLWRDPARLTLKSGETPSKPVVDLANPRATIYCEIVNRSVKAPSGTPFSAAVAGCSRPSDPPAAPGARRIGASPRTGRRSARPRAASRKDWRREWGPETLRTCTSVRPACAPEP